MALDESQTNKICKILQVVPSDLEYQISLLSTDFTAQREADVETELSAWDVVSSDFTNIHPNLKNFGAEIKFADAKNDIRKNIAVLLERPDWANSGSGMRLSRG